MVMIQHDRELWRKIQEFRVDDEETAFTFDARLARENGWSRQFASRVVEEYKRFIYLAMTAGHPVTPSDQVDQAWHLHLTYTRSYWERLCNGVLPRPLHHNPTKGGTSEGVKFNDWYSRTKESYERTFGAPPPADIWPASSIRFGDDLEHERVNRAHFWIISKRRVRRVAWLSAGGMSVVAAAGCTPLLLGASDASGWSVGVTILVIVVAIAIVGIVAKLLGRLLGRTSGHSDGGCSGAGWWWWGSGSGSGGNDSDSTGSDHGDSGCGSSGCSGGGCGGGGCGGGD